MSKPIWDDWDISIPPKKTNINNTNYTNDTKNKTNDINTNDCIAADRGSATIKIRENPLPAAASGIASRPPCGSGSSEVVVPAEEFLPSNWRGLKLDLFSNPELKLKAGVIKNDGTTQELVASLNSPKEYIWRRVPAKERSQPHWQIVQSVEQDLQDLNVDYCASKFALPKKAGTTKLVVFLFENADYWFVRMVVKAAVYDYMVSKKSQLSPAQRKMNMIATHYVGKTQTKLLDLEDLGL